MLLPINAEKACDKVQHIFLIKKKKKLLSTKATPENTQTLGD
jgi:hypothetical protein